MNLNAITNLYGINNIVAKLAGGSPLASLLLPGYRPSQWGVNFGGPDAILTQATNIGGLMFDGILSSSHESSLTVTKHPVQYGANISDHAILNPARLTLDIEVSDVMGYIGPMYLGSGVTKSQRAYSTLLEFQRSRIPMVVWTKLRKYENMVITNISVNDDYTTAYALKATIELEQMLLVNVSEAKVSARAWTTGAGNSSTVQPDGTINNRGSLISEGLGDGEEGLRNKTGVPK